MKNVIFYLIEKYDISNGLTTVEQLACNLAADKWRQGKRVLIACEENDQAFKLDEAMWVHDPNAFVPHNLAGEGPNHGAPIELCWPQCRSNTPRDVLINLLPVYADFVSAFHEIIDFVPNSNVLKQLARDRYKIYRNFGFQLTTIILPKRGN
ncbi:DNA polymerase III subunit chi [Candidatus Gullanella endobia]|uniref:DNA polymerase III subunit chi n=1 Tax=Candidatus Gullanella endobia TaxID=1070130 RepID=A0A143WR71_9ENTR|nr:DNA polymerase III subunit chi [Candidatus Gullanella endobia]CUX96245.1 DNA polymerase III subunit chi [Candidatus Gullanella endobia]